MFGQTCRAVLAMFCMLLPWACGARAAESSRLNILLITADDMNYDAPGFTGNKLPGLTPNLDRLASQSIWFVHAHVTIAVCQPSRSVLMTGRYPCRNGAMGFEPIREDVPTLQEQLRAAGYLNGILAKNGHLAPRHKFCWDVDIREDQLGAGRDPARYYEHAKAFFERARRENKPFFLMANSQDPHRPFPGSEAEDARRRNRPRNYPAPDRIYRPDEIIPPEFLPDLPVVRQEVAQYYSSVRRCDQTVGEILRALKETGREDDTLVMFLSDNGMAFPFAKTNCYLSSTRTPWLVRWPAKTKGGTVDREHFISGIDFMPTVLEAAGLPAPAGMDGRSFVTLLRGARQEGRDRVFTVFHQTSSRGDFPMRALQDHRFGYIFNAWSDGQLEFRNESRNSPTFNAMQAAASSDPKVAERTRHFLFRVKEEFYDYQADPAALRNLIDDPKHAADIARFRAEMLRIMRSIDDPQLPDFEQLVRQSSP
ncbi:MAG TPA: sulfatase [Phycisphaerae bacterium]|nr:sulfatase [Phycisphaerae bacterium]